VPYLYTKGMSAVKPGVIAFEGERDLGALQDDVTVHCIVDLCPLVSC
jgi:hypothetical protein